VKIPAAWLIEQAGFHKGYRSGNVGISTKHSLALVNLGGASAAEMISLKDKIQHAVMQKFDILLQPEPVFVGFE
jgi:UDP-N-acetylmuramate dehydrogenase